MSSCQIDHSVDDVVNKLTEQKTFLPGELFDRSSHLLQQNINQDTLNELFHLLKKYDLDSGEGKVERNEKLEQLIVSVSR